MIDATPPLPAPLVPAECDLSGLPSMLLDIGRLFSSDFYNLATGDEFRAGVTLWGKSWEQSPPASLASDERILARLAGVSLVEWRSLSELALRNWMKCADGRLYHPVVAEKALTAWIQRIKHQERSAKANAARNNTIFDPAPFARLRGVAEAHLARVNGEPEQPSAPPASCEEPSLSPTRSGGPSSEEAQPLLVPSEVEVEVEVEVERKTPPERALSAEPEPSITDQNSEAWTRAVQLLTSRGRMRESQARSLFGKLLRDGQLQASELLPAVVTGEANGSQEPAAYLRKAAEGVARRKSGSRQQATHGPARRLDRYRAGAGFRRRGRSHPCPADRAPLGGGAMNAVSRRDDAHPFTQALASMAQAAEVVAEARALLAEPWLQLSSDIERRPPRAGEVAWVLDRLPSAQATAAHLARIAQGETPATVVQVRQAIGALIDGYPNASPHAPVAYVESLVFEASRPAPGLAAITAACSELRRTSRFPPSAAELLAELESATSSLAVSRKLLERAAAQRQRLTAGDRPSSPPSATPPPADARAFTHAGHQEPQP